MLTDGSPTFFHGGISNQHLMQVFQKTRPLVDTEGLRFDGHVWQIAHCQQLEFRLSYKMTQHLT